MGHSVGSDFEISGARGSPNLRVRHSAILLAKRRRERIPILERAGEDIRIIASPRQMLQNPARFDPIRERPKGEDLSLGGDFVVALETLLARRSAAAEQEQSHA